MLWQKYTAEHDTIHEEFVQNFCVVSWIHQYFKHFADICNQNFPTKVTYMYYM